MNSINKIYISKIHGAKIRDEELTQRVSSLEKDFTNVVAAPSSSSLDKLGSMKAGDIVNRLTFCAVKFDYKGISYDMRDADSRARFKAAAIANGLGELKDDKSLMIDFFQLNLLVPIDRFLAQISSDDTYSYYMTGLTGYISYLCIQDDDTFDIELNSNCGKVAGVLGYGMNMSSSYCAAWLICPSVDNQQTSTAYCVVNAQ